MKLNEILTARVGKTTEISARYRRVILLGDYETKTYEQAATIELDSNVTGIERDFALAVVQAQLEYNCVAKMYTEGIITEEDYKNSITRLEIGITALAEKAGSLNINLSNIIEQATDNGGDAVTSTLAQNV